MKLPTLMFLGLVAKTSPVFAHRDETISDAVRKMIDHQVSSILIHDNEKQVVGILTERDIVRKFTLLELDQKWGKTVGTIMTRPVVFARADHLREDVIRLHLDCGLRHFPVILAGPANVDNVVGIATVTDFCRSHLLERRRELDAGIKPGKAK